MAEGVLPAFSQKLILDEENNTFTRLLELIFGHRPVQSINNHYKLLEILNKLAQRQC